MGTATTVACNGELTHSDLLRYFVSQQQYHPRCAVYCVSEDPHRPLEYTCAKSILGCSNKRPATVKNTRSEKSIVLLKITRLKKHPLLVFKCIFANKVYVVFINWVKYFKWSLLSFPFTIHVVTWFSIFCRFPILIVVTQDFQKSPNEASPKTWRSRNKPNSHSDLCLFTIKLG